MGRKTSKLDQSSTGKAKANAGWFLSENIDMNTAYSGLPTLDLLSRLVAFDTVSDKSNLDMVTFIEQLVAPYGATLRRIPSPDGRKANLLVTFGPMLEGGILLSGHMDVVPVNYQEWRTDPFIMTESDGKLYGRGCVDMKGFLAVSLSVAMRMASMGLRKPLHLAFSYDEELGCFGAHLLIDELMRSLPAPRAVIVGEPSNMNVVNAHKSAHDFQTVVQGKEAHSSMPQLGANAIFAAGRLLTYLDELGDDLRAQPRPDLAFDTPYATVSSGLIRGGVAGNVIPAKCAFSWEVRAVAHGQAERISKDFDAFCNERVLPRLAATAAQSTIITTQLCAIAALEPEIGGEAERLMMQVTGDGKTHSVSFCTEAGLFQARGLSTVVCGPGDIAQAHQPNEFIEISQLQTCERVIQQLVSNLVA